MIINSDRIHPPYQLVVKGVEVRPFRRDWMYKHHTYYMQGKYDFMRNQDMTAKGALENSNVRLFNVQKPEILMCLEDWYAGWYDGAVEIEYALTGHVD